MVLALLHESDLLLSDDVVEVIVNKVRSNLLDEMFIFRPCLALRDVKIFFSADL